MKMQLGGGDVSIALTTCHPLQCFFFLLLLLLGPGNGTNINRLLTVTLIIILQINKLPAFCPLHRGELWLYKHELEIQST